MVGLFALVIATGSAPVCDTTVRTPLLPHPAAEAAATLRELYEGGVAFPAFLDATSARRALWVRNSDAAAVPADLLDRANATGGPWRILAVAVDACSDSVNVIPYVAKLAELVPGIDLRIIDSTAGRDIMEAHRTPDDRAATPTLVLLDAEWHEAGCFIERPGPLQAWYAERTGTMQTSELTRLKMEWYAEDAGRATLEDVIRMIEGAAAGSIVCFGELADRLLETAHQARPPSAPEPAGSCPPGGCRAPLITRRSARSNTSPASRK